MGRAREAQDALPRAKELCEDAGTIRAYFQLQWVQGLVFVATEDPLRAERCYLLARSGLFELGDLLHYSVVSLDLAVLYLETNRNSEVLALIREILPVLETFGYRNEGLIAVGVLNRAVHSDEFLTVSLSLVRELRDHHAQMMRLGLLDR